MNENEPEGGVVPLTPLGRRAHVSEISGAVAFLASDDSTFVTGTELVDRRGLPGALSTSAQIGARAAKAARRLRARLSARSAVPGGRQLRAWHRG